MGERAESMREWRERGNRRRRRERGKTSAASENNEKSERKADRFGSLLSVVFCSTLKIYHMSVFSQLCLFCRFCDDAFFVVESLSVALSENLVLDL